MNTVTAYRIDIYGEGDQESVLKEFVKASGLSNIVFFSWENSV